jgi:hypothetical protein
LAPCGGDPVLSNPGLLAAPAWRTVQRWLWALAVVLPLAGCDRRPPPDVILLSIDSLRPDHLGCYG